jgi:hypothetical protein
VSADAGAENDARAKTPKRRQRAKPAVKGTALSGSHLEPSVAPELEQPCATTVALEATAAATMVSPGESVDPLVIPRVAQHPPAPVRRATHLRTIVLAGVAFLVAVALAFPRHASTPATDAAAAGPQPEPREQPADLDGSRPQQAALPAAPAAMPVAASAAVTPRAVSAASKKMLAPKREKNRTAESTKSRTAVAFKEDAATTLPASEAIAPPAPASVSSGAAGTTAVTITGCLEISVDHDEFRLTDTEGADAPRSRSWRTGFLKKGSAPVALVEPPDRLALQTRVGRRVAATGLLTSHDLKVSALRVVGPACN